MRTDTEPIALAQSQAAPTVSQKAPSLLLVSHHILRAVLHSSLFLELWDSTNECPKALETFELAPEFRKEEN
jgi:hypothetical protein